MKNGWRKVNLGDVCSVIPGYAFKSEHLGNSGVPVIKIKNIQDNGSVDTIDVERFPEELLTDKIGKYFLDDKDILIAMTGATAGKVGRIRCNNRILLNQRVAKIKPNNVNADFIWSIVSSKDYRNLFFRLADGAAQPNMSGTQIENVKFLIPGIEEQNRIASTLSTYDDLIENNTRRIKILEEMARLIYREWFLEFKAPGIKLRKATLEEKKVIGKNVFPEGWEVKRFGDVLDVNYGKQLPTTQLKDQGEYPVYGAGSIIGYYDEFIAETKTALITCRGNGSGTVWRTKEKAFVTNNSFLICSKDRNDLWQHYFIVFLLENSNVNSIKSGSAQPQITIEGISSIKIIVPSVSTVRNYCNLTSEMIDFADMLDKVNTNLRQTRDLLLPKLISGEVEV
jgi:type I restriction enzyme, S subunit